MDGYIKCLPLHLAGENLIYNICYSIKQHSYILLLFVNDIPVLSCRNITIITKCYEQGFGIDSFL